MSQPATMFEKIWSRHAITRNEAGQSLLSYPLNVENGLLYIEVEVDSLVARAGVIPEPEGPPGPGHDPCLFARVDDKPSEHLG